ncbi:MAG TPA: oligosaccharide flippase family protein [Baekduia sp.]|nr:oligosaccharide flippase family protein [Baekduia sp.]
MSEQQATAVAESDVLDSREAGGRIIRGGGLRVASYVAGILIGLISAPLLVRHLSVADYGLYATVSSIVVVVMGITEGGLGNVAIREYATADGAERRRILDSLLGLRVALAALGAVAAIAFTLIASYPAAVTIGVAIAGLSLFFGAWQATLIVALQAELRLGSLAGIDFARQVATTVLVVVLVVAGVGLIPFFTVPATGAAVLLLVTIRAAGGAMSLRPRMHVERWKHLLRQTAVYAVATALGVLYFQIAIIATSLLSTHEQAGYYGASFRIIDIANGVPWLLASSAFPLLARSAHNDADRLRYATGRLFETAAVTGGAFCVAIAVGAPFALQVVGGDKLDPAIPTLRLLAAGVPFTFLVATWAFTLLSLHRHRSLLAANGLAVVTALVLSAVLVGSNGARGAAITTVALEAVLATAYGVALTRARPDLRPPLVRAVRVLAALGGALATGFLLPVGVVPATFAALAVYGVLALVLRAVPPEIAEALRARLIPARP